MLLGAAYVGVKRALAKDQGRRQQSPISLPRLLAGELALLGLRVGRWKIWSVLMVVFVGTLTTQTALSSATPGPVLDQPWRTVLSLFVAAFVLVAWTVIHGLRSARSKEVSGSDRDDVDSDALT